MIGGPSDPPAGDTPPPADDAPPADKPAEEQAPADLKWEDFTLPEGMIVSDEQQSELLSVLNKKDATPQQRAQDLINLHGKLVTEMQQQISDNWTKMQDEWVAEIKADKDIGGANLEPALGRIGQLVTKYGSPELKSVFDLTGAGNNPHMIRFLNAIAKDLTEPGFVAGQPGGGTEALANKLYPSMKS